MYEPVSLSGMRQTGRINMKHIVKLFAAGIVFLITASIAQAGWDAYTTADVNMREGSGNRYRVIVVIPEGEAVYVHGCPRSWCDVEWASYRGYVYGRYLSSSGSGYYEGYVAPPPVIVTPGYDGGYIHVPRKRKHYDRHKRKRKLRRHRSREHYERPSRSRKHYKRSKRRKSFEQPRKRRSYRRSGKRRSMHRRSRRNQKRLERRRNRGEVRRGSHRHRKHKRKLED